MGGELRAQLILDHAERAVGRRRGRDTGDPGRGEFDAHGYSPSCGDELWLRVHVDEAGTVRDITWSGHGCTVSQAGASMLAALVAATPVTVTELAARGREMAAGAHPGGGELDEERFGDAVVFGGGWLSAQRARCASLAWMAFAEVVSRAERA